MRQGKNTNFTTAGIVTYVAFPFSPDDCLECIYNVCVADENNKRINYMYVKDIDYRKDINYTLLYEEEFNDLPGRYAEGYELDSSMTADYAVTKRQLQIPYRKADDGNKLYQLTPLIFF